MFIASLFKLHEIHSADPLLVLPFVSIHVFRDGLD